MPSVVPPVRRALDPMARSLETDGFERQIPGGPCALQEFQPAEMLGTICVYGVYLEKEDGLDS